MKQLPNMSNIDPRQPRLSAGVTSVFALAAVFLGLGGYGLAATLLYLYTTIMFLWSVFAPKAWHPYKTLFKFVSQHMSPPEYLEDPRGPFFAQKVGLLVSSLALVSSLFSPIAGVVFGVMLFGASSLNAYFNVCLGCLIYLRLKKIGINL
jgi:hypothetical protein